MSGQLFVSVAEAAAMLGVHENTIRRGVASGEIPHHRVRQAIRIPMSWVLLSEESSDGVQFVHEYCLLLIGRIDCSHCIMHRNNGRLAAVVR